MVTLRINRENMVSSSEIVKNFSEMLDKTKESPIFIMRNNDIEEIVRKRKQDFDIKDGIKEKDIMNLLDEE